jgi:anti-sigma-K factor RskA
MSRAEWLELAELYALGILDGDDLVRFEAYVAEGDPDCLRVIRETRELLSTLPKTLPPMEPSPAIRQRLLAQIDLEAMDPNPRRRWRISGLVAAILVAAACLVLGLIWGREQVSRIVHQREQQVRTLQEELARRDRIQQLLENPRVRSVALVGLAPRSGASGRVLFNRDTRTGVLLAIGLPAPPAGKAYELWGLAGTSAPIPAGVFTVDRNGRALHNLPPFPKAQTIDGFAITLEPAGGSAAPTPPILLAPANPNGDG